MDFYQCCLKEKSDPKYISERRDFFFLGKIFAMCISEEFLERGST